MRRRVCWRNNLVLKVPNRQCLHLGGAWARPRQSARWSGGLRLPSRERCCGRGDTPRQRRL